MHTAIVRKAGIADLSTITAMCVALWPEGSPDEHEGEARAKLEGKPQGTLPLTLLVAEDAGQVIGFIEVGLRSHADGCDPAKPVGFIEGWYVDPLHRGKGVGGALMRAAEDWSRAQGCHEVASDTWADNQPSIDAHRALGFEIVDTCVNFRKSLSPQ